MKFLLPICLLLSLVSCDYYCDEEIFILNDSDTEISVKYKIEYSEHYPTDSIQTVNIPPHKKQLIHLDSNSHGMKCEDIPKRQDRIYFLEILGIVNAKGDSCTKAYNDCGEWLFDVIQSDTAQDIQRYELVLNNQDF